MCKNGTSVLINKERGTARRKANQPNQGVTQDEGKKRKETNTCTKSEKGFQTHAPKHVVFFNLLL
jgi:hypothetical protein